MANKKTNLEENQKSLNTFSFAITKELEIELRNFAYRQSKLQNKTVSRAEIIRRALEKYMKDEKRRKVV